eukprot:5780760-Lingulodinium_polyedra.AAC.1
MSVCGCVRACSTKLKCAFRLDEMIGCVYATARLRQCPCLCAYAFTHVLTSTRVKMLVYPAASVATPRLRPRPNQEKAK